MFLSVLYTLDLFRNVGTDDSSDSTFLWALERRIRWRIERGLTHNFPFVYIICSAVAAKRVLLLPKGSLGPSGLPLGGHLSYNLVTTPAANHWRWSCSYVSSLVRCIWLTSHYNSRLCNPSYDLAGDVQVSSSHIITSLALLWIWDVF